jgi:nucleotide-binding universal stress UspA family protein
MGPVQQILCPVDLSDASRPALEHAVGLARAWHAQLTVLHVYLAASPFETTPPFAAGVADEPDRHQAAVQAFVEPVAGDLPVTYRLAHGSNPPRTIDGEAEAIGADLIVIGTHGKVGLERVLLGSSTGAILRKAPCPVLVVPSGAASATDGRFRQILCAIDFSPPSLAAFRFAVHLAHPAGAAVTLLHAIEQPPELHDRQIVAAFDVEAVRAGAEAAARHRLAALSPGADAPDVRITPAVRERVAHQAILEEARTLHADLIVLGADDRRFVERWVFGSNTDAVLRDAQCPVLIVRSD